MIHSENRVAPAMQVARDCALDCVRLARVRHTLITGTEKYNITQYFL